MPLPCSRAVQADLSNAVPYAFFELPFIGQLDASDSVAMVAV